MILSHHLLLTIAFPFQKFSSEFTASDPLQIQVLFTHYYHAPLFVVDALTAHSNASSPPFPFQNFSSESHAAMHQILCKSKFICVLFTQYYHAPLFFVDTLTVRSRACSPPFPFQNFSSESPASDPLQIQIHLHPVCPILPCPSVLC